MRLVSILIAGTFLFGCPPAEQAPTLPACDLSLDGLADKSFVMLEAVDRQSDVENPMARMKFIEEDGKLVLKYTVKSVSSVYDYDCTNMGKELFCGEPARWKDICQALETHEKDSCTTETLDEIAPGGTADELAAAVKDAREVVNKYRGTDDWEHFVLNNNNLGNKLRGMVYAKIDTRKCRLVVDDMYMTVYNGKKIEDYNPVGKNPFVTTTETYLFETCNDGQNTLDWNTAERPDVKDITPDRSHEVGKPVYYFYYGEKGSKAEDDCTYSMDVWANWLLAQEGVVITPDAKGKLDWQVSHTFAEDELVSAGRESGIIHMIRSKECAGKKEKIDTICGVALF